MNRFSSLSSSYSSYSEGKPEPVDVYSLSVSLSLCVIANMVWFVFDTPNSLIEISHTLK